MRYAACMNASLRRVSYLALALAALTACSGGTTTDAGDASATDAVDVATDGGMDAFDAFDAFDADDASDAMIATDAVDAVDATPDVVDVADASEAGVVAISALVHVTALTQNCMPAVAPDPLSISGSIDVTNIGTVPLGPISASNGTVLSETTGAELARFTLTTAGDIAVVGAGASGTTNFTKDSDSLDPANGCTPVPCGTFVRVAIPITGPNVPSGTRAFSPITMVQCVF